MLKPVKKIFKFKIIAANDSVTHNFTLDKNIKALLGLLVTSNKDDMLYCRGSQKIEINRVEIFPDEYESKLIMSGINVSPNERYYNLKGMNPGNGSIKVVFQDEDDGRTVFEPYIVKLYIDCEVDDAV